MLSGVSYSRALNDLGRFIQRAEEIPRETRRQLDAALARSKSTVAEIKGWEEKNKSIYVNDVADNGVTRQMVSFLL